MKCNLEDVIDKSFHSENITSLYICILKLNLQAQITVKLLYVLRVFRAVTSLQFQCRM